MILVIGGAYQGKLSWATQTYGLEETELCDLADGFVVGKRCYYHMEALTKRGEELPSFPEEAIVIAREVGCGVVPMEAEERAWRERHGAVLQELARRADRVIRVFCGIDEVLK